MTAEFDIVIRNATVHDGSGAEPFTADVAIEGDRIARIGNVSGSGVEEIDASGLILTPGFVDIHTHYDGQVTWENTLRPSSQHGVTSVVMGNCAIGFAPCRPQDRELLVKVVAGVEDIPEPVMTEALAWNWETFPDYMNVLRTRHADVDFAAQVPHSALRLYVMGKRGADREPATATDLKVMTQLVREGMEAGAIGVSTSHTLAHRTTDGVLAPAETSAEEELHALAAGLKEFGGGVFELIIDFNDPESTFAMLRRIVEKSGRPLSFTLLELPGDNGAWRTILDSIEQANADGLPIRSQVAPRAVGMMFGLDLSINPFSFFPSYQAIQDLPLAERVARLRDPQLRAKILSEQPSGPALGLMFTGMVERMSELGSPPNYEPSPDQLLGARAAALGISARELAYDLMAEKGGSALLYLLFTNYNNDSLDAARTMMTHPNSVIALGDGGAHYGYICDAAYPTFMLTHWLRDRDHGRLPLPWMIQSLTSKPAVAAGLLDRGLIAEGFKADLNLIDLAALKLHAPQVAYDLPGGGRRLHQHADGYRATLVSGKITYRNGVATGLLPGRLIEGPQARPH